MTEFGRNSRDHAACPGAVAAVLCLLLVTDVDAGKLYRWVDVDGNVHYTDRMPAAATDEAHAVIDASGTVTDRKQSRAAEQEQRRQRAAEQVARERRAELERQRAEDQRRHDRIIRQTFTTERDIEMTREDRVSAVQVQINIADHGIARLDEQRGALAQRLQSLPTDAAAAETTRERIHALDSSLEQRRTERAELAEKRARIAQRFASYLQRFREIHASRD